MEIILRNQIVENLLAYNNLIQDSQHGFRQGKSCLTNLLYIYGYMHDKIDKKPLDIIYLDLQKTFYKVPQKRLITKLKSYGINGKMCNWVED